MRTRMDSRPIAAILFTVLLAVGFATETDQFSVPKGQRMADLGPYFTRIVYDNLESTRRHLNEGIQESLESNPSQADWWRSPSVAARVMRRQFPQAQLLIEGLESKLYSRRFLMQYPGQLCAYKDHATIFSKRSLLDPGVPFTWHISSTMRIGDVYLGTDKIGHFFDKGSILVDHYFKERGAGLSPEEAEASAVGLGTGDSIILGEDAVLGSWSSGVYANADLACDLSGMLFFKNLTLEITVGEQTWPPMLVLEDGFWEISEHVRRDSDFFTRFITDHFDEALNPSKFRWGLKDDVRKAVAKRGPDILDWYCDPNGSWRSRASFEDQLRELQTFFGREYGHSLDWDELVLISRSAFPDEAEDDPFMLLREGDRDGLVASLDADPSVIASTGRQGETLLHLATRDASLVELLLARDADPRAKDASGRTAMHWATRYGDRRSIELLLDAGADPGAVDNKGRTALHDAAGGGNEEAARILARASGSIDPKDRSGLTPLQVAAREGETGTLELLADLGADVNGRDSFGWTACHHAASGGWARAVSVLAEAGAEINAADPDGTRAAHLAARAAMPTTLSVIGELGGDLLSPNNLGATPLHEAAQAGDAGIVEQLVRAGASLEGRNIAGKTPGEVARSFDHHDASNVLRLANLGELDLLDTIRRFGK